MTDALAQAEETRERHTTSALDPRHVLVPYDDLERTIGVTLRLNRLRILWKAGEFPVPKQISAHRIAWILADLLEWVATRPPVVSSVPEPVVVAADAEMKALAAQASTDTQPSPATRGQRRSKTGPPASPTEPTPAAPAKPRRRAGTRRRR